MLHALTIRDMLIIDQLELEFTNGLNVLTGETGAGKSILLDCLGFVLGGRGRAEMLRQGADQGDVTAEFDLGADHPARAVLVDLGLEADDTLILRRVNARDGRKTGYVNDRKVSADALRRLGETLLEIQGQQDDRGLLNPRSHRDYLDQFGGLGAAQVKTRDAWRALSAANRAVADAEARIAEAQEQEEFLRHAVAELAEFAPEAGEDAALDQRRRDMQAAERVREDMASAMAAMSDQGAEEALTQALKWLVPVAQQLGEPVEPILRHVNQAVEELSLAQQALRDLTQNLGFDAAELERVEERLFALRALARKHDQTPDALADFAAVLTQQLHDLDAGVDGLAGLRDVAAAAQAEFDDAAAALTAARGVAARALDLAMTQELGPLKMERAVFTTRISPAQPGPSGVDDIYFEVAPNPGAPAGPINKIASGGELSRFLLALKVSLRSADDPATMIFDEIDRGVGGATANAVGRRLAALGREGQVLVVTHSPQVAAMGERHFIVSKSVTDGVTLSHVIQLSEAARQDEIARMLSGDAITEEARAAARSLLAG